MSILYRRFILVASLIAAMGVLTAHLIQETRRGPVGAEILQPVNPANSACKGKLCLLERPPLIRHRA